MQRLWTNMWAVSPVQKLAQKSMWALLGTVSLGSVVMGTATLANAEQTAVSSASMQTVSIPTAQVPTEQVAVGPMSIAENRLVLSLRSRRVYLYQGEVLLNSYPVAVGTAETPTPTGEFTVSKMVENPVWQSPWTGEIHEPGPNSALGLRWIEFSTTEAGSFGFHGTPTVDSIGQAASNGCVRMYNEDVVALYAQVGIGTPVTVVP